MAGFYQATPPLEVFLMHFNPNHDRKNGQFTSGSGGSVSKSLAPANKKITGDFSSTEKKTLNEKELKVWYKNAKETPSDDIHKYDNEFDKTKQGKELRKKYDDIDDNYWDIEDKYGETKAIKMFDEAENNYLREMQKYSVNKFLKNDAKKGDMLHNSIDKCFFIVYVLIVYIINIQMDKPRHSSPF